MSRAATGDTVVVQPSNNIYTVLVIAATIVVALSLVVIFMRATDMGIKLFG